MCWETLNLPDPSILRHLTFYIMDWEDESNMISFLEEIPEANNLASIIIYVYYDDAGASWQRLDELLVRMRDEAHFECLEIRVGHDWRDLEDDLPTLLPRFASSGQLVVTHLPRRTNPVTVFGIGQVDQW